MTSAPKSERLHIGIFGRTNVGKSILLNIISGQDVALTSSLAGTTTDVVEKSLELSSLGPVVLLDTAGIDDTSTLAAARKSKMLKALSRCDVAILVVEDDYWSDYEEEIISLLKNHNIEYIFVSNKYSNSAASNKNSSTNNNNYTNYINSVSNIEMPNFDTLTNEKRDIFLKKITVELRKKTNNDDSAIELFSDIISPNDIVVLVTPIDSGAPKGRLIMPQVQTLRALLDKKAVSIIVQPEEYKQVLNILTKKIKLVVCDSQVVKQVMELTPEDIYITTFSILFARLKGDLLTEIEGAEKIKTITPNDKILIAEACSHHAQTDDIATVKIPKLLEKYLGFAPQIHYSHGRDYPENLSEYKLVIHCGSCMITRKEKINRINLAISNNIAFTNYGIAISFLNGYMHRAVNIFN